MPFDLGQMESRGTAVPLVDDVLMTFAGGAHFSVSNDGSHVYIAGAVEERIANTVVWVDRQGDVVDTGIPAGPYVHLRLSPDDARVALDVRDENNDIWIWEFANETMNRLTVSPESFDRQPVWSPDGQRIVFSSSRVGGQVNLFWQAADGTGIAEQLTDRPNPTYATSFGPSGAALLYGEFTQETGPDVWALNLEGERDRSALVATPFIDRNADVSPDGRWLAYQSNEAGQYEIYVAPFPDVDRGGRRQLTVEGGTKPTWSPDASELFFWNGADMTAVAVETESSFSSGNPQVLFQAPYSNQLLRRVERRRSIPDDYRPTCD